MAHPPAAFPLDLSICAQQDSDGRPMYHQSALPRRTSADCADPIVHHSSDGSDHPESTGKQQVQIQI